MRPIHKEILNNPSHIFHLPKDTEFLVAREQRNMICVWYMKGTETVLEPFRIEVKETGSVAPENIKKYLGLASCDNGNHICHVFLVNE